MKEEKKRRGPPKGYISSRRWACPKEMIQANINVEEDTNCWVWGKKKPVISYPCVGLTYWGKHYNVHRGAQLAYIVYRGGYDRTLQIAHICNRPQCVNPDHLYPATLKENQRDTYYNKNNTRVDAEVVERIVAMAKLPGSTVRGIHQQTDVSVSTIKSILAMKNYVEVSKLTSPIVIPPLKLKIQPEDKIDIVEYHRSKLYTIKQLAKKYKVSYSHIAVIIRNNKDI